MTIYEMPQMRVLHVYGQVDRRGAVLCFRSIEGAIDELVAEALGRRPTNNCHTTIEFAGSRYDVYFVRTDRVEAFTVRQHSNTARPLGLAEDGPRVTQLHFYRPHGKSWLQLEPDLNVHIEVAEPLLV